MYVENLVKRSIDFIKLTSKSTINLDLKDSNIFINGDEEQLNRVLIKKTIIFCRKLLIIQHKIFCIYILTTNRDKPESCFRKKTHLIAYRD